MEESKDEAGRLGREFGEWIERRRAVDSRRQHKTQLDTLERVVVACVRRIEAELDSAEAGASIGELYERCRRADRQLVFVRRLWRYYGEKWDQRDDDAVRGALAVADEIVWSCYATPFRQLEADRGPAPLAYVSASFSPHAIADGRGPAPLRPSDQLLREIVTELPLPVIGVPPICVARPWWLVLIAHEVGHRIFHEIDDGLAEAARGRIERAAAPDEGDPRGIQWGAWTSEIFADAFAAAMVGGAHLWALVELERGSDEAMLRQPLGYPPPLVRQALGMRLLAELGLEPGDALPAVPPPAELARMAVGDDDRARAQGQLDACSPVARSLAAEPLVEETTLGAIAAWRAKDMSARGKAGWWRKQYAAAPKMSPEPTLAAARLAMVGALAEWARIADEPDEPARQERTARLRERVLGVVPECREDGVRAARATAAAETTDLAARIAARILELPAEDPAAPADPAPPIDELAGALP